MLLLWQLNDEHAFTGEIIPVLQSFNALYQMLPSNHSLFLSVISSLFSLRKHDIPY